MAALDFNIDAIEKEITIDEKGVGRSSVRGAARIANVTESLLRKHFRGAYKNGSELVEMLEENGFDVRTFAKDGVPDIAVGLIVKYFAWMAGKLCTAEAKAIDKFFTGVGVRVWMQSTKGWKPAQRSAQFLLGDVISREPLPWESHFSKDWARNAERITGYKWEK